MTLLDADARRNMLKSQILPNHILDGRVLDALSAVARDAFVPDEFRGNAYVDYEIPLIAGRSLMEPVVFAHLLEYAAIAPQETVLDVACASGYSAAVLSRLARKVVALEEDATLADEARKRLGVYGNVQLSQGPLAKGYSAGAPYDVILIEGAIQTLPQALADQLCEGGRLVAVEHASAAQVGISGLGQLVEYRKLRGSLFKTPLKDASAALLAAFRKADIFAL